MIDRIVYIWRQQAQELLNKLSQALNEPSSHPVLFNLWGVSGVGKTTLLDQMEIDYERLAFFIMVPFSLIQGTESPLDLMLKIDRELNRQLPAESKRETNSLFKGDFRAFYQEYQQTLHQLTTQPIAGKLSVDIEQKKLADWLVNYSLSSIAKIIHKCPLYPKIQELLARHPATEQRSDLRELMQAPLAKLTEAFTANLIAKAAIPIVIVLDNYEQASKDIDIWLREYLLLSNDLRSHKIRIVLSSRRCLLEEASWQKIQQEQQLIYSQQLNEFSKEETRMYLQQLGIIQPLEIQQIYRATKGLPYYLNWLGTERENGREITPLFASQTVINLLLQKFTLQQKQVLELAACCRWFNRALIRQLIPNQGLKLEKTDNENIDWFDWLTQCYLVETFEGYYRLNNVIKEVLRLSLWQNDREHFYKINNWLANYFETLANTEVPPELPIAAQYENPDWRHYMSECLYYSLFGRLNDYKYKFFSHLFAGIYLRQTQIVLVPYLAIFSEVINLSHHHVLSYEVGNFLTSIKPAIECHWIVTETSYLDLQELDFCGFTPSQIEVTLQNCDFYITYLTGVAKFAAVLYKARRCQPNQRIDWLRLALEQAEQIATTADPKFSSSLFLGEIADEFYNFGLYEAAIYSYEKALEFVPESDVAWCKRGMALRKLGLYEDALVSYQQAIQLNSFQYEAWYNMGIVLRHLKRYEEAFSFYQRAIELQPNQWDVWNSRGILLRKMGRLNESIASYEQSIKLKDDESGVWYNLGIALDDLGDYERALMSYDRALQLQPNDYEAWYNRGITLRKLKRYEVALQSYEKALEIYDLDASVWYNRAYVLDELKLYEEAIASYDRALSIDPDDFSTWYNRGLALRKLGWIEEAIASFDRAIELEPNKHKAWFNRGMALRQLGAIENAIGSFDRAAALQPNEPSNWYNTACCYALLGNVEQAVKNLKIAINLSPNQWRTMAITDTDFDTIRSDRAFQNCLYIN